MTRSPAAPLHQDKGRLIAKVAANSPCVILVEPRLAENIGTTSRAMRNCGLTDMRLVDPKVDWLNDKALAAASGGEKILERAQKFDTFADAIADLERVYATTARRHGLTSEEVAHCDAIVEIPMNPEHSSLNLAQAVLVVAYEWFQAGYDGPQAAITYNRTQPAAKKDIMDLFVHLERELIECGFLRDPERNELMVINIRNMLQRAELTEQEVRTFHGIIKELRYGRRDDRPPRQPGVKPEAAPKPLKERVKSDKSAD